MIWRRGGGCWRSLRRADDRCFRRFNSIWSRAAPTRLYRPRSGTSRRRASIRTRPPRGSASRSRYSTTSRPPIGCVSARADRPLIEAARRSAAPRLAEPAARARRRRLRGFDLRPSRRLARIHRRGRNPWWFSSDGSGRFDLEPGRGTCDLAEDPLGAFVEASATPHRACLDGGGHASLHRSVLRRGCGSLTAGRRGEAVRNHAARSVRVATTIAPSLARRRSPARASRASLPAPHDPSGSLLGIALFGAAGEADWAVDASGTIPDDLIREAEERFGILVVPASSADSLDT